jgi:hypothetical protein
LQKRLSTGRSHVSQIFRSVDEKIARPSQHSKRGNQSGKAETVIAVQMGNENMVEPAEFGVHLSHLELRSFPTVNHVELIAQVYDLRSGEMSCLWAKLIRTLKCLCQIQPSFFFVLD